MSTTGSDDDGLAAAAVAALRVLAPDGLDDVLQSIVETALLVFRAAACSIATVDSASSELVYRVADGAGAAEIVGVRMPVARGISGFVASSGQTLAVDEVRSDPRFAADVAERTGYVPASILAAPIAHGDRTLGVFSVLDRGPDGPQGVAALDIASAFARQAAGVLEAETILRPLDPSADGDTGAGAPVAEIVTAFAALAALGDSERDTAARLLADFAAYARRRGRR
jgi:GAF domain-containing protein